MELARRIISDLFPSRCILCQKTVIEHAVNHDVEICSGCYALLPHNDNCCIRCALPLADDIKNDVLCGRCIDKLPEFDYSYSLFSYKDEIVNLVHRLKFGEKINYARSVSELLLAKVVDELLPAQGRPECIIPVPLHKKRLRERGYNQSVEISRVVAKKTGIPVEHDAVIRKRSTLMQTGLKAKQRLKNISGAFDAANEIKVKHVLIVDDVITTGSTVNELARVLKKKGVDRVGVLSIARAPLKA